MQCNSITATHVINLVIGYTWENILKIIINVKSKRTTNFHESINCTSEKQKFYITTTELTLWRRNFMQRPTLCA